MSENRSHFQSEKPDHIARWGYTKPDEVLGTITLDDGSQVQVQAKHLDAPRLSLHPLVREFVATIQECNSTSGMAQGLPAHIEIRGEGRTLTLRDYPAANAESDKSFVPYGRAAKIPKDKQPIANHPYKIK